MMNGYSLVIGVVFVLFIMALVVVGYCMLRKKVSKGMKINMAEHKEIRQEIEIGDKKLLVRIQVLENKK
jgi:hypothetical protein